MNTLSDFKINAEYALIIKESVKRKLLLGLNGMTYGQLQRNDLVKKNKYELHHIIPRYRLKQHTTEFLNAPENIALLTPKEHLLAHHQMCLFETGKSKQSARNAFLMLFNLKKLSFSEIESLTDDEIGTLADASVEARLAYFGSKEHKDGSSKAGKISGEKRKQAFANDPDFRDYLLGRLKLSPEKRKEVSERRVEKYKNIPPWRVYLSENTTECGYSKQQWKYFDTIYEGVVFYNLSYKILANILKVEYKSISNIVRVIKDRFQKDLVAFENFRFYKEFLEDYSPTLGEHALLLKYYSEGTKVPWCKMHGMNTPWLMFDRYFRCYVAARQAGYLIAKCSFSKFYGKTTPLSHKIEAEAEKLYACGVRCITQVEWYSHWLMLVEVQRKQIPEYSLKNRFCVYLKYNKYCVTGYDYATCKAIEVYKTTDYDLAVMIRDWYELVIHGELSDIRHFDISCTNI